MNIVILLLIIIFASELRFADKNCFNDDYCSVRKSNAIKGIFVVAVFLSHTLDYFDLRECDIWVEKISEYLKQLVVVPFFFYSGFGIMESIKKKGADYVNHMPVDRVLRTILYADVAVVAFALVYLICGYTVTAERFFLSLVFWESIENSTWYFFVIVFLYLATYIGFRIFPRNHYLAAAAMSVFSIPVFFILIRTRDIFWYNTYFIYHFGLWYSIVRKPVEKFLMRNDFIYAVALLAAFLAYSFFRNFGSYYYFMICGCFMMMFIVGITMKVSIDNPVLQYLGRNIQGFYMFHRLPLFLTCELGLKMDNASKFILSFLVTVILCGMFDSVTKRIDRHILSRLRH